jgi:hypothetical protein
MEIQFPYITISHPQSAVVTELNSIFFKIEAALVCGLANKFLLKTP